MLSSKWKKWTIVQVEHKDFWKATWFESAFEFLIQQGVAWLKNVRMSSGLLCLSIVKKLFCVKLSNSYRCLTATGVSDKEHASGGFEGTALFCYKLQISSRPCSRKQSNLIWQRNVEPRRLKIVWVPFPSDWYARKRFKWTEVSPRENF